MFRASLMSVLRFRLRGMGRSEFDFLLWDSWERKRANEYRVEIAVKQILCGMNIKVGASVMNKECLEWFREWAETH
jgi:hypothetical protein